MAEILMPMLCMYVSDTLGGAILVRENSLMYMEPERNAVIRNQGIWLLIPDFLVRRKICSVYIMPCVVFAG